MVRGAKICGPRRVPGPHGADDVSSFRALRDIGASVVERGARDVRYLIRLLTASLCASPRYLRSPSSPVSEKPPSTSIRAGLSRIADTNVREAFLLGTWANRGKEEGPRLLRAPRPSRFPPVRLYGCSSLTTMLPLSIGGAPDANGIHSEQSSAGASTVFHPSPAPPGSPLSLTTATNWVPGGRVFDSECVTTTP